jgi:hypothetical protein
MIMAALLALQAPAAAPPCTLADAVPAAIGEIARDPRRKVRFGRCIRLEGYVLFDFFYADAGGVYAVTARNNHDRDNDGWLGLYFRPGIAAERTLRRGTVWGILDDCRTYTETRRRLPDAQYDVAEDLYEGDSACAYFEGLILRFAGFRSQGPAAFERLTDAGARDRVGDLRAESPALRPPGEIVALADRFIAALRAGDRVTLRQFVHLYSELDPATPQEEAAFDAYLRGEGGSPLRELIAMPAAPAPAFFRELDQVRPHPYPGSWYVCFCRTADCAGRWPIHHADAGAYPTLPYLCLVAYNERLVHELPPDRLGLSRQPSMFPESAR